MRLQGLLKRTFADNAGIGHGWNSKQHFIMGVCSDISLLNSLLRESSFNMTRGGDEDIETQSLKF